MINKELSTELFTQLSLDDVIDLYREGYRINEQSKQNKQNNLSYSTEPYASDNSRKRRLDYGFMKQEINSLDSCKSISIGASATKCPDCDLTKNYCIFDTCISKNYILYGGIALVAIILLR